MSMALKASRTIYCSGFDQSITFTHSNSDIQEYLEGEGWEVAGVYIMKNRKSLKIEFNTTNQATTFLSNINTSIGHVILKQENKEREIDPTIQQCWSCREINTDHSSHNCRRTPICLKCGQTDHKFFDCPIPKHYTHMKDQHRKDRYCRPCRTWGDHTSLDHTLCPTKR